MRPRLLVLTVLLAACGERCSCSCGEGDDETSETSTATEATSSSTTTTTTDAGMRSGLDLQALDAAALAQDIARANAWLHDDSPEQAKLAALQQTLRSRTEATKAASESQLAGALGVRAGDYAAQAEPMTGTIASGEVTIPQAVREYVSEQGRLYVKVTDTGPSPALRAPIIDALTSPRALAGRFSRGALVHGYPALVTFAPANQSGKAAVIVNERYLVEARLAPTTEPEGIIRALEAFDWSRLGK